MTRSLPDQFGNQCYGDRCYAIAVDAWSLAAGQTFERLELPRSAPHAILCPWLCRQRVGLLERHVAGGISGTGQRRSRRNDGPIDVDALSREAVTDSTLPGLLAGQGASQIGIADDTDHHGGGGVAAFGTAFGRASTPFKRICVSPITTVSPSMTRAGPLMMVSSSASAVVVQAMTNSGAEEGKPAQGAIAGHGVTAP